MMDDWILVNTWRLVKVFFFFLTGESFWWTTNPNPSSHRYCNRGLHSFSDFIVPRRGLKSFVAKRVISIIVNLKYRQLRARRALLEIKDVPLRTRRALLTLYSNSTLLVLNGTSLSCNNALLALNWRYVRLTMLKYKENNKKFVILFIITPKIYLCIGYNELCIIRKALFLYYTMVPVLKKMEMAFNPFCNESLLLKLPVIQLFIYKQFAYIHVYRVAQKKTQHLRSIISRKQGT